MREDQTIKLSETDKKILALYQDPSRHNQALKFLVDTYQQKLYWLIRRIVIIHEDADDVLQNTLIRAWQGLKNFRQQSSLFTWLYRIAINQALLHLEKKAKEKNIAYEEVASHLAKSMYSDPYFKADAVLAKMQEAILALPEKQRVVFNMRYFEELSYEEMSEILDTSVGALKASYHHAVKKIEEYLLNNN